MDKKFCPYCMNPVKEGETCKKCGLTEGVYTPRDHHLPLGSVLHDRYLVGRVLGEGGFGITYIGCDLNLEMKVAIKEYFPIDRVYRFSQTSLQVSNYAHAAEKYNSGKIKFLREARTMARLDKQQNIVGVRDFFEENDTAYIVMEYVEGTTLKELVNQRGGRIPAGELLHMLEPLFPALTSVHDMGLIHRDISPDNLMLENGKIKLLDFGCARESAAQSETMTIALKQGYAPIEQYQHKGQGPWTDVYALSATIYYCLTGKTPQSAVDRLSEEELVPPRKLGVDLTASQETALLRGMHVKSKERFQSVEELYAALYTSIMPEPVSPEPTKAESTPIMPTSVAHQEMQGDNTPVSENADNNVILDSADEPNLARSDYDVEKPAKKRIVDIITALHLQAKRNLIMILAGCAALLVVVICVVVAVIPSSDGKETNGFAIDDVSGSVTPTGSQLSDEPIHENVTAETLFAHAVTLEKSSAESLQMLMDDETVTAIRIPKGVDANLIYGAITVTKPVIIEKGTVFDLCDPITVQGDSACLWIEGEVGGDCVLQTVDGGRIIADDSDCLSPMILWLEKEEDLRILNGGKPNCYDLIIGGKNTLFQDAVEVRDEASLRQAMNSRLPAIICEDITIKEYVNFQVPILIKEGVTVVIQSNVGFIGVGGFLWNEGIIQGGLLQADSDTEIINHGEIGTEYLSVDDILVNLGELSVDEWWMGNEQSEICNIGTLRLQNGMYHNYPLNLVNFGTVICSSSELTFYKGTKHVNYGEIRIEAGITRIWSYMENMSDGRIIVCDNAELENRGFIKVDGGELICEPGGRLNNEFGAIYYNIFTDNFPKDGWVYFTNARNGLDSDRACQVASFGELFDALQNPEVDKIYLSETILWNSKEALTLTKEMVISDSAELIMGEGSELILDGCFLQNIGYLKVDHLTLTHGAGLHNLDGTIELISSKSEIKLGNAQGERGYSGTDCLLNDNGEILHSCKIDLYDNAFMIQRGYLQGPLFYMKGHAYVANCGEIQWGNEGVIDISGKGRFHNLFSQDWSQNMMINIDNGGEFGNYNDLILENGNMYVAYGGSLTSCLANITFGDNMSILNYGSFSFAQGGDGTILRRYLENQGIIDIFGPSGFVIDAPYDAENPARLDNLGEVRIWDPDGYIRTVNGEITGNEVIIKY